MTVLIISIITPAALVAFTMLAEIVSDLFGPPPGLS